MHKANGLATRVLVVSDPVYTRTDSRFTQNGRPGPPDLADQASRPRLRSPSLSGDLERLPATAIEARAIASQFNTSDVDSLSGFEATRDSLLKRDMSQYRIIHIAAHAVTEAEPCMQALPKPSRLPCETVGAKMKIRAYGAHSRSHPSGPRRYFQQPNVIQERADEVPLPELSDDEVDHP